MNPIVDSIIEAIKKQSKTSSNIKNIILSNKGKILKNPFNGHNKTILHNIIYLRCGKNDQKKNQFLDDIFKFIVDNNCANLHIKQDSRYTVLRNAISCSLFHYCEIIVARDATTCNDAGVLEAVIGKESKYFNLIKKYLNPSSLTYDLVNKAADVDGFIYKYYMERSGLKFFGAVDNLKRLKYLQLMKSIDIKIFNKIKDHLDKNDPKVFEYIIQKTGDISLVALMKNEGFTYDEKSLQHCVMTRKNEIFDFLVGNDTTNENSVLQLARGLDLILKNYKNIKGIKNFFDFDFLVALRQKCHELSSSSYCIIQDSEDCLLDEEDFD